MDGYVGTCIALLRHENAQCESRECKPREKYATYDHTHHHLLEELTAVTAAGTHGRVGGRRTLRLSVRHNVKVDLVR